jgi:hypothetical protein
MNLHVASDIKTLVRDLTLISGPNEMDWDVWNGVGHPVSGRINLDSVIMHILMQLFPGEPHDF